jgi:hypothetical protein
LLGGLQPQAAVAQSVADELSVATMSHQGAIAGYLIFYCIIFDDSVFFFFPP